jgi:spermidine/putrescine transport system substrate-binding protein
MKKLVAILLMLVTLSISAPALAEGSITVFNWYDYIDESVISMFEQETGIQVKYANFTTNEEMYAKLSSGAGDYDVIFPSDYVIERMIKEGLLEKLDMDKVPNAAGVVDWLKKPAYDPEGAYSVPYMWGTVGLLYNTTMMPDAIDSWAPVFDPANQKSVFMLDSIRDSLGIALKYLGYDMNTNDQAALDAAKALLIKQKSDGIVKGYLVDEVKDKMVAGEAPMAVVWSGDALYAMSQSEDLKYVVPKEGSNVWVDGMCIPKGSKNKELAEQFINFMCRPDIAKMNMEYIYYSTPIQAVIDGMTDDEKNNQTLNPPQDVIDRCEFFHDISSDMAKYDQIWMEIRS